MPTHIRRPIAVWSAVGLIAFYVAADCFLTYRGLPSPFPLSVVARIAEDKTLDAWHQRTKTLLPGLVYTALVGCLAHHFAFRCAAARATSPRFQRMSLPFGLARLIPQSDQRWLSWAFIFAFHVIPIAVTIYLASDFFSHPNLYYRDDSGHQIWVTFFSVENWKFFGLFHRRPILWSNDIEMQRGIYPLFLLVLLACYLFAFLRFFHVLLRPIAKKA